MTLFTRQDQGLELQQSNCLHQGLNLLQANVTELSAIIQEEALENPILNIELPLISNNKSDSRNVHNYIIENIQAPKTQDISIYSQARESFNNDIDLQAAEYIIGNLDKHGFLDLSIETIALEMNRELIDIKRILLTIQHFDPPGIATKNIQESLLLQAKIKKLPPEVMIIISNHYQLLINGKIKEISKKTSLPYEHILSVTLPYIASLATSPIKQLKNYSEENTVPDAYIRFINNKWSIELNTSIIPIVGINNTYKHMLLNSIKNKDEILFCKEKLYEAKMLLHNIKRRQDTLFKAIKATIKKQSDFLHGLSPLKPLYQYEIANEIGAHSSTITRAIKNKLLSTPIGMFYFADLFSSAKIDHLDMSMDTICREIIHLITNENAESPLSDEALTKCLQQKKISIARRTVSKYREKLKIPTSSIRKKIQRVKPTKQ